MSTSPTCALPVAITMGDPAGIGPEIILKAFAQSPELTQGCCVFGDLPTLEKQLSLLAPLLIRRLAFLPITDLAQVGPSLGPQIPVIQCGESAPIAMGHVSAQAGAMAA
ncbi:MAG: 4-hydroxythreonine-4-phosphate dehydrogenase PdxA, partial [Betaproteobacteria bacterium]|nr:4-hydroxythreonine-4-phosphate dehydrogenase PdxA [Betaproteobacteria bacterium]